MKTPDPKSETPIVELVRVYNRSTRQTFDHGSYKISPSSFLDVPPDVAKRWQELFPNTVIEACVAQKELGGAAAALNAEKAEHAKTKALLEAATARTTELNSIVTKQVKAIEELETELNATTVRASELTETVRKQAAEIESLEEQLTKAQV